MTHGHWWQLFRAKSPKSGRHVLFTSCGVVPKGVINFPRIVYAMRSLVPVGRFRNVSGHLFTWLVCASFQWSHGLLLTVCIVWHDKDKVIGFKRTHRIHLGWWNTGSPKIQLFQLSQHLLVTKRRLISSSVYFLWLWHHNAKCSYLNVPDIKSYILSRGRSVFRRIFFSLAVCLSTRYTKVQEVVFATSL